MSVRKSEGLRQKDLPEPFSLQAVQRYVESRLVLQGDDPIDQVDLIDDDYQKGLSASMISPGKSSSKGGSSAMGGALAGDDVSTFQAVRLT